MAAPEPRAFHPELSPTCRLSTTSGTSGTSGLSVASGASTSGAWRYTRSRPGALMNAPEPLANRVPSWSRDETGRAIYGFRRITAATS